MTDEITRQQWNLLWAYEQGVKDTEAAYEEMTEHIHQIRPTTGLDRLLELLRDREREEALRDDRVLTDPEKA
jgi:hypothetical protein